MEDGLADSQRHAVVRRLPAGRQPEGSLRAGWSEQAGGAEGEGRDSAPREAVEDWRHGGPGGRQLRDAPGGLAEGAQGTTDDDAT
jgi:hypothetical protein